jgi:hypothetical protein
MIHSLKENERWDEVACLVLDLNQLNVLTYQYCI